jgi:uncharacterized protein (TIGR00369 family)
MSERQLRDLGQERWSRSETVGLWRTLGYELRDWDAGRSVVAWQASPDYGFGTHAGHVVQGGLVTALLDAAMGGACWTVLDDQQIFLTADLRVEFLRSSPADAELVATGTVVRATQRVVFCAGELHGPDGVLLATSRCTQVVLPAGHHADRLRRGDGHTDGTDADAGADGAALD